VKILLAMSTRQCERLLDAIGFAAGRRTQVLVLAGGAGLRCAASQAAALTAKKPTPRRAHHQALLRYAHRHVGAQHGTHHAMVSGAISAWHNMPCAGSHAGAAYP
jgi:hypothetical protein